MYNDSMQADNPFASFGGTVADAAADARTTFIRKTYIHLGMAIYTFVALEWILFKVVPEATLQNMIVSMMSGYGYLIFFAAFIGVSWLADAWARSETSRAMQYLGLMLYVVAEAVFFVPLLYFAQDRAISLGNGAIGQTDVITAAGAITLIMFGGLTAIVFVTGKDFSFLRAWLFFGGLAAFGLILCSMFIGMNLGVWFSVAMIAFASGYVLYDTSNIIHHYRTDQYVAASLALFASVALLFWYVLRLLMSLSNRN
jgi:uncharacterized protein